MEVKRLIRNVDKKLNVFTSTFCSNPFVRISLTGSLEFCFEIMSIFESKLLRLQNA